MRNEWLALQIMGIILQLAGAYIIGNWWMVVGVAFMLWGYGLMISVKNPTERKRRILKDWLGNDEEEM